MKKYQKENFFKKPFIVWSSALICCFLWGSAFPCIKIGYQLFSITAQDTATQILFAGVRFFWAGILTIFMGSIGNKRLLRLTKQSFSKTIKLSLFQTVGQYFFFYIGLAHTSGARASIIEGVNVFVAIFVSSLLFHQEKITFPKLLGSTLGFLGIILMNLTGQNLGLRNFQSGDLFVFLSTICYAFSSVLLKQYAKKEDSVTLCGYQFLFGGILMGLCGFLLGGRLHNVTLLGTLLLFYLAFVSAAAYSLWGILLQYHPISKIAAFGFMNPVFGLLLSAVLLQEYNALGITSLFALLLVSIGILVVNSPKGTSADKVSP